MAGRTMKHSMFSHVLLPFHRRLIAEIGVVSAMVMHRPTIRKTGIILYLAHPTLMSPSSRRE